MLVFDYIAYEIIYELCLQDEKTVHIKKENPWKCNFSGS